MVGHNFGTYPVALVVAAGLEGSILHSAGKTSVLDNPVGMSRLEECVFEGTGLKFTSNIYEICLENNTYIQD